MKISNLLLVFLIISFSKLSFSQANLKVKTVDFQVVYKQLNYEIDKKELGIKPALTFRNNLSFQLLKRYQMDYLILQRRFENDLFPKDQQAFYASYLKNIEDQIKKFEINTNKILAERQKQIDESILLFFKENLSELRKEEESIIFSNDVILYKDQSIEDLTQTLLNHIFQNPTYNNWLGDFEKSSTLIEQIKDLNKEPKKIFPKEEYEWAEKQLKEKK